jgi:hypothetical protein
MTCSSFRPGALWPDTDGVPINAHGGGLLNSGGTYYWFGEFKTEGGKGNRAWGGVSCYSSTDLYNWRNEGIALPVVRDDPDHDIIEGCVIERPKVIYNRKTNRYVMWFHLELVGQGYAAARVGVAVAERPAGPYTYRGSFRPDEAMSRDMTLFVDDDERDYLFTASEENQTLHISLLSDDYLNCAGRFARAFEGRYMEAPAVFKHDGRYYFIGSNCTGWPPNPARSAVATDIWGPWTEMGNPCLGPNANLTFEGRAPTSCPWPGAPARSFSWPTSGARRTPSTGATSGCPSASATARMAESAWPSSGRASGT